jgi:hypothetical protein
MTSNIPHASATIIPFPTNRRTLARRDETPAVVQPVTIAASGSWYHEEAIQEAKWIQKH